MIKEENCSCFPVWAMNNSPLFYMMKKIIVLPERPIDSPFSRVHFLFSLALKSESLVLTLSNNMYNVQIKKLFERLKTPSTISDLASYFA